MDELIDMLKKYKINACNKNDKLLLSNVDFLIKMANELNSLKFKNEIDRIIILPDVNTGYSEFRIMNQIIKTYGQNMKLKIVG
ncbi:hypothetical protein [Zophobihabitans entericus]|uniref:Uncharacterized protein n=1 Tax=Zophobihabitans entericus TaxID=1635327 RepID=A0A6G9ICY1_9GAMM|nr:hypothetical protein [Zophobihabitans entericus]QIQ21440.1 hypothetical protein IPMB12_06925 [Zophobihabitans entericus]